MAGVNDTRKKHKVANLPQIFVKIRNGPNGILRGLGKLNHGKKPEYENLVSDTDP